MRIISIIKTIFHPIMRHNTHVNISERFPDAEIMPITLATWNSHKVQKSTRLHINWWMTIKIVSLILVVWLFFILPTYAAETTSTWLEKIQWFLEKFLSLCSRLWIVLAILAGKLMTNDFVYGAFIHMDIYLWKIRNIMKNFANFALVGLVLFSIVESLTGKALDVKKVITNTLLAGILIQASWFLMGAVIDISTVATAGIGGFPTSFLKNDIALQTKIKNSITTFKADRPIIDFYATGNNVVRTIQKPNTHTQDIEDIRENILPSYNSVSGPFIYLGMWVFNFQNYLTTENTTWAVPLTLGFALRLFLLFLFTVALLLLLIANIMRIWLLWIFIIWSPFLILSQVFDLGKWKSSWLGAIFTVSNLVAIIFKPVIFVAGMSLMLIVIVSMQTSITWSWSSWENNLNGVNLWMSGTSSTLTVDWISNISVNQTDILGKDVLEEGQNLFSHIIMLLLTIFIMRRFVKLSLTLGWWTIWTTMEKLTGLAQKMAQSAPILPWWSSFTAARSVMEKNKTKTMEWLGIDEQGNFGKRKEWWGFETNEEKFSDMIGQKRFGEQPYWKSDDYKTLQTIAKTWDTEWFFAKSQELAKARQWWLSMSNTDRIKAFALLSNPEWFNWPKLSPNATAEEIETYFNIPKNAKALYDALWWRDATGWKSAPQTYAELQDMSFFAKEE